MDRLSFLPSDLHSTLWNLLAETGVISCITASNKEREQLTVDILNCALFDIFYSMEPVDGFTYEELFAKYTEKKTLFETLQPRGVVDWSEQDLPKPTPSNPEAFITVKIYPEHLELTQIGFEAAYMAFRDQINDIITRALGARFNPFSIVDLQTTVDRVGQVHTIELYLAGDIRHKYYLEKFPDGRYRANHNAGNNL